MKIRILFSSLLLLFLTIFLSLESRSQLTVTSGSAIGMTPQEFVQTYLVGTGIAISNATYNGSAEPLNSALRLPAKSRDEIGSFTNTGGAATQLGINGGVILSTGYVEKTKAGLNPSDDMWGNNQPAESDPDLVILAGNTIHDKSILQFDFVPQTDVVTFRYVFGSIEFDGFCGSINDAFGLFLSGPGISGGLGFANDAVNIALLPNSTNYVTIFNICAADQGNLGNGVYSWWNVKKDFFSFNRLTYVFSATYTVVCNQTYHMKFAIGDASDGVLDSGVFLEQNSFSSNNVTSTTSFSNPLTGQLLVEGCSNASLVYSIPQAATTDLTIDLAIHPSGTATQADILPNPFPLHATILAGQLQSTPILIVPVPDALPEPTENLVIKGTTITCSISNVVTTEIFIKDLNPLSVGLGDVTICNGSSATLAPVVTGGQQILPANVFNYLWSTADTTASIVVSPPAGHHVYTVTVTDACNQSAMKEVSVDVGTVPGPAGPIAGNSTICTPVLNAIFSIQAITGADNYIWTLPAGAVIAAGNNTNSISVNFDLTAVSGPISVKGHSIICGDGLPSVLNLVINPAVPAAGPITGPSTVCQGPGQLIYSITPLPFTTSYEWIVPSGVTVVSGATTNQITCIFTTSAISGNFSVRGYNTECNFGIPALKPVLVNPLPAPAGPINGPATVCQGPNPVTYFISSLANTTLYEWTVPSGVTILSGANTNQITCLFTNSAISGSISVRGFNPECSFGTSMLMPVTVNPLPGPAGPITGPSTLCQGPDQITYSIAPVANATLYEWSVPSGVTIVNGATTNQITCIFSSSAISGNFSVKGYNALCSFGTPSDKPVLVNPLPGPAGVITSISGAVVCTPETGIGYRVDPITNVLTYTWVYSGTGVTLHNNNASLQIDFSASATSGVLTVKGENGCGSGPLSSSFDITVHPKPIVDLLICNDIKTTKNGRPIVLKGGRPVGTGGIYTGTGVSQISPGVFVFDPSNNNVIGGGTSNGINHNITYSYTNTFSCFDEKSAVITVYGSNSNDPCPGTVKDYRDNQIYPTFLESAGPTSRCWTATNLNYGNYTDKSQSQTENCLIEKYCQNNVASQCSISGGYYQWGELMQYQEITGYQDICMPGWHVASVSEWDNLILGNSGNGNAGSELKDLLNINGFHGLLEGLLYNNNTWAFMTGTTTGTMFWTSAAISAGYATARGLNIFNPSVSLYPSSRVNAFHVRCVRN